MQGKARREKEIFRRDNVSKNIFIVLRLLLVVVVISVALVGAVACDKKAEPKAQPTTVPSAEVIELSYSNFFPPTHACSIAAEEWGKEVEERTGGRVKINFYHGGTLTPAPQVYDGVVKDISDIGMSCLAYTRGRFPLMEGADLPLGYASGSQATWAVNEVYKKFQPDELADAKVLYLHAHGPGLLHTKKPVRTLEDLKGMKIRSTGLAAKIVEALGGIPVAMPQGETYEALQKGTVDGTLGPMEVLKGWKQGEVVKYTTECYSVGYTTTFFVVMNLDKWNSLPADIQDIIADVDEEWIAVYQEVWDAADIAGREFSEGLGNEVIPLSEEESVRWSEMVKPLLDDYVDERESEGLQGEAFLSELQSILK
ncbi:MAG: TRAP transporter substrate-binding protein [Dehalococcoidia bacterium]|nr:TRAP transporter substrate-binding protein [Dehalococcoidia bacterium]